MMKKILITIIFIFANLLAFSQWEFNYFVLKVGLNHHLLSSQPTNSQAFFLHTVEGDYQLFPDTSFFPDYVPGIQAGLNFHFDFTNDKGGIIIGAEYMNAGISARYSTVDEKYSLIQTHRINAISVPLLVKFGNEIFNQQRYFTAGIRFNFNFGLHTIETVSWTDIKKTDYVDELLFVNNNLIFVAGFNFLFFNMEFDFFPQTFLDKEYSTNIGSANDKLVIQPYKYQPDNLMFVQTNLYIPLSSWTTSKSYFFRNLMLMFR